MYIDPTKAFLVFLAYIILDWLYAQYTIQIQKKNAIKAGLAGATMYCLMAYGVIIYSTEPIYIIFIGLGSFIGTFLAVKQQK